MQKNKLKNVFCTFSLDNKEFALDVSEVREVVNSPNSFTVIPLAPTCVAGMFNLRGMLIPVFNLSKMITGKEISASSFTKIAIIEYQNFCIGFLFENTAKIMKVDERQIQHVVYSNKSDNVELGSKFIRLDEGKEFLRIIDPVQILTYQKINISNFISSKDVEQFQQIKKRQRRKQCISFLIDDSVLGLNIESVQEIIQVDEVSPSALENDVCRGRIELRGKVVPVLDLASLLNLGKSQRIRENLRNQKILILKKEKELFGILVDHVESLISYFEDEILPFPSFNSENMSCYKGCLSVPEKGEIILLELLKLSDFIEVHEAIEGHRKIYQNNLESLDEKRSKLLRKTFVTFSLEKEFGIDIKEIKEIVDCPQEWIRSEEIPSIYRGMINLRGELILVIDARELYQIHKHQHSLENQKIFIFEVENKRIGFLVDSVNEIMTFNESSIDKFHGKLPDFFFNDKECKINADISETLYLNKTKEEKKLLMVLDLKKVISDFSQKQIR